MPTSTIYSRAFEKASSSLTKGLELAWNRAGNVPFGEEPISQQTAIRRARSYNLLDAQGQAMRGMTRSVAITGGYGNQNPMGPDMGQKVVKGIPKQMRQQTDKNRAAGIVVDPSSQQVEMAASPDATISYGGSGAGSTPGE